MLAGLTGLDKATPVFVVVTRAAFWTRFARLKSPSFNKKRCAISILINSKYILEQWKQNKIQFLHEEDMNRLISKILKDEKIHGKFNLAPDSFSQVNELVPNKKYIN